MAVLEVLGFLILGALALLLVRALFRPWHEGREGNQLGDPP
jgi:hypothetical protein